MSNVIKLPFNINLGRSSYVFTTASVDDHISQPDVLTRLSSNAGGSEDVYHIQLHWARKSFLDEPMCNLIDERLAEIFENLSSKAAWDQVAVVDIIDCGDVAMNPLSAFEVINYMLEVLAEYVRPDCKCRVFSANFDEIGIVGSQYVVLDTASEEFRAYLMGFINASLMAINERSEDGSLAGNTSDQIGGPKPTRH